MTIPPRRTWPATRSRPLTAPHRSLKTGAATGRCLTPRPRKRPVNPGGGAGGVGFPGTRRDSVELTTGRPPIASSVPSQAGTPCHKATRKARCRTRPPPTSPIVETPRVPNSVQITAQAAVRHLDGISNRTILALWRCGIVCSRRGLACGLKGSAGRDWYTLQVVVVGWGCFAIEELPWQVVLFAGDGEMWLGLTRDVGVASARSMTNRSGSISAYADFLLCGLDSHYSLLHRRSRLQDA